MFTHFDPELGQLTERLLQDYRAYFSGQWSSKQLSSVQLLQMRRTVAYVRERSAFYKKHLEAAPRSEQLNWTDFSKLPFTTKHDLRRHLTGMLSRPVSESCFFYETTGTTGVATPCPRDYVDCIYNNTPLTLAYETILKSSERKHLVALSGPTEMHSFGDTLGDVCKNLGLAMIKMWPASPMVGFERALFVLSNLQATVLMCTPGMALSLAKEAISHGYDLRRDFALEILMLTGELSTRSMMSNLEELWGARAYNFLYGAQETLVTAAATRTGHLHTFPLNFIYEVIDPETGELVSPRDGIREGELVVTNLFQGAKPLVRYRTGDMVRLRDAQPGELFPSPTLSVLGRERDRIAIGRRRITAYDLEEELLRGVHNCLGFQMEILPRGPDGRDTVKINLHLAPGPSAVDTCRGTAKRMEEFLGCPVQAVDRALGAIGSTGALVSWKAARLIDHRVEKDNEQKAAERIAQSREARAQTASRSRAGAE